MNNVSLILNASVRCGLCTGDEVIARLLESRSSSLRLFTYYLDSGATVVFVFRINLSGHDINFHNSKCRYNRISHCWVGTRKSACLRFDKTYKFTQRKILPKDNSQQRCKIVHFASVPIIHSGEIGRD